MTGADAGAGTRIAWRVTAGAALILAALALLLAVLLFDRVSENQQFGLCRQAEIQKRITTYLRDEVPPARRTRALRGLMHDFDKGVRQIDRSLDCPPPRSVPHPTSK